MNSADPQLSAVANFALTLTGADGALVELADGPALVCAAASGIALGLRGTECDADACRRLDVQSVASAPIYLDGSAAGVLKVLARRPHAFGDEVSLTLGHLGEIVTAHLADAAHGAHREDALTGLPTKDALDERLRQELARLRRHGGTLSVVLFQLDLDETHRDNVVRFAASCLTSGVARGSDVPFYPGNGLFVLLLPETDLAGADVVAGRFEEMLAMDGRVRTAWGTAEASPALTPDDLLEVAGVELQRRRLSV